MRGCSSPQSTSSTYSVSASGWRSALRMTPTFRLSRERSTGRASSFLPLAGAPFWGLLVTAPFSCVWSEAWLLLLWLPAQRSWSACDSLDDVQGAHGRPHQGLITPTR